VVTITHTNAKGKLYYLHQGTTKTGKPKYYFSMESEGHLAESIPEGFEIYENPNAQVFLRRIPPKLITDEERRVVEEGMRTYADVKDYKIDIRGNVIAIYTADQDMTILAAIVRDPHASSEENARRRQLLRESIHYSELVRFMLLDDKRRTFVTQRYCFIGSIDDWIEIGRSGKLAHLVKQHVKHLGKESGHLFTFLERSDVEATNWKGEQAIRPAVVNRKSWGGNFTWAGADTQEVLSSVLATARAQGKDPISVLVPLLRSPTPRLADLTLPGVGEEDWRQVPEPAQLARPARAP